MKYDVSICLAAIRTEFWTEFYNTASLACKDKTFEVVFCGPYDVPVELKEKDNIKFVQDFGSPTRCMQLASMQCEGELIANASDDGIWVEDSMSKAINMYNEQCKDGDGLILRYTEGYGRPAWTKFHAKDKCWNSHSYPPVRKLQGVKGHFRHGTWMIKLSEFRRLGGLDCKYGAMNFSSIDLLHRMQAHGGTMYLSPTFVQNYGFDPHSPYYKFIQDSSNYGWTLFEKDWITDNDRYIIPFDTWKDSPEKWARFSNV